MTRSEGALSLTANRRAGPPSFRLSGTDAGFVRDRLRDPAIHAGDVPVAAQRDLEAASSHKAPVAELRGDADGSSSSLMKFQDSPASGRRASPWVTATARPPSTCCPASSPRDGSRPSRQHRGSGTGTRHRSTAVGVAPGTHVCPQAEEFLRHIAGPSRGACAQNGCPRCRSDEPRHGRGLPILSMLAKSWGFGRLDDGRLRVWFEVPHTVPPDTRAIEREDAPAPPRPHDGAHGGFGFGDR